MGSVETNMADRNLRNVGLGLGGAILFTISVTLISCTNPIQEESTAAIVHMCSSCHSIEGRSVSPTFPRLAGQKKEYLIAQLNAFRDHTRADRNAHTYMWGMAAHLNDPTRREDVAAYFSSRTPVAGTPGDPADIAAGKKTYNDGMPDLGVPGCAGCHGEHAQGLNTSPRLAGQHSSYIEHRLEVFASDVRKNETTHKNSKKLTANQVRQLADYLESE
jgi:cytochrome c553